MTLLQGIFGGALLSDVLGTLRSTPATHAALLLTASGAAGAWVSRRIPKRAQWLIAADGAAAVVSFIRLEWAAPVLLFWAVVRIRSSWGAALLTAGVCRAAAELAGSGWLAAPVCAVAAAVTQLRWTPREPVRESDGGTLLQTLDGALHALAALAAYHSLQFLSPVERGPFTAGLLVTGALLLAARRHSIAIPPAMRVVLLSLAWISLPGLLDRNLYPAFSTGWLWPLGWLLAIAPWSAALLPSKVGGPYRWAGALGFCLAAWALPSLAIQPIGIAASSAFLFAIGEVSARNRKPSFLHAAAAAGLLAIGLSDPTRLHAAPEERVREEYETLGRTLSVVQNRGSEHVRLRDRFHSMPVSSETAREARRAGLLPFRIHPRARQLLLAGGASPFLISAMLEIQPDRIDWLEPEVGYFKLSHWWIAPQAAANTHTQVRRVATPAPSYLALSSEYYDTIVLGPETPWADTGSGLLAKDLPAQVLNRLYPDGIAIQWILRHQWTPERFAALLQRWSEAFGDRIELWRADLDPQSPLLAIVARGPNASTDLNPGARLPDSILGARLTALSLRLSKGPPLSALTEVTADRSRLDLPWRNAAIRNPSVRTLSANWLIEKFLPANLASGGPSEGGLRYTRAWMLKMVGDNAWKDEKAKGAQLMGFDPTAELYPALKDEGRVSAPPSK